MERLKNWKLFNESLTLGRNRFSLQYDIDQVLDYIEMNLSAYMASSSDFMNVIYSKTDNEDYNNITFSGKNSVKVILL
jgi:hypothetical protein